MAVSAPIVKCPCCGKHHLILTPQVLSDMVGEVKAQGKWQYLVNAFMSVTPKAESLPFGIGGLLRRK